MPLIGIAKPDNEISIVENRKLQTFPIFNKNKIEDFTKEFDDYVVDQFPMRNRIVDIYTKIQLIGKNTTVRNVIILEDWLFIRDYNLDVNSLEEVANSIDGAVNKDKDIDFYYIIFPSKTAMLADLYPKYMDGSISKNNNEVLTQRLENIEGLNIVNIMDILLRRNIRKAEYYYRTDLLNDKVLSSFS